jgi:hypothetical protein
VQRDRGRAAAGHTPTTGALRGLVLGTAAMVGAASVLLLISTPTFTGEDFHALTHAARLVLAGASPYQEPLFVWSPVAAWIAVPLLALPSWGWVGLHLIALLGFRDLRVAALGLIAWPFWQDAGLGNVLTFVVLAAWWAIRGNRVAIVAYVLLCVLMPRPLMMPVLAWLLWRRPMTRPVLLGALLVQAILLLLIGHWAEWATVLLALPGAEMTNPYVIGPSRVLGWTWLVIGIPVAVLLLFRRRLGLASLAASPYWLPYYLLYLALELEPGPGVPSEGRPARRGTPTSR